MSEQATITVVRRGNFNDLLPLVRAYCDFYEVDPPDADLLALFEALHRDREREGVQLIGRRAQRLYDRIGSHREQWLD
jgi:hypothetical protein